MSGLLDRHGFPGGVDAGPFERVGLLAASKPPEVFANPADIESNQKLTYYSVLGS